MARVSAGIALFRPASPFEVLLVHPGGPLWAHRDEGAWSLPKGEVDPGESLPEAALRELFEETGWRVNAPLIPLGSIRQRGGKTVHGFAALGDVDPETLVSQTLRIEWPPRSGMMRRIPEVDRAAWFDPLTARSKINVGQIPFLERLAALQFGSSQRR